MPELPDVETFRRRFDAQALGRTIANAHILDDRLLEGVTSRRLSQALSGHRVASTSRHGKYLFAELDNGASLVLHFGMTGDIVPLERGKDAPRYTVLHIIFDDSATIAVTSQRKLGRIALAKDKSQFIKGQNLGPDALDSTLDAEAFREALGSPRSAVKSALMDQTKISGIGNIYSDEILYQAGIHPKMRVGEIGEKKAARLFETTHQVLEKAIESGVPSEGFEEKLPKTWLLLHREKGAKCPRCGGPVRTIKTGGRTAYFCSSCQQA